MIGYPLVLEGAAVRALVVGGGAVAARKVRGLLDAGASVRVVAPELGGELATMEGLPGLEIVHRPWEPGDVDDALLVIAATDDRLVNARVAEEGRACHRLVNMADEPAEGNCVTVAAHRAGELLLAVYGGGVPGVAARVRDAIAERFDDRYADAVHALAALRFRLLATGDGESWARARRELLGTDFCRSVESGGFTERVTRWR